MSHAAYVSDVELIYRVVAGDSDAADVFVARFTRLVWWVLVHQLQLPKELAGEVYQDVALPYHLATQEYASLVKERLEEGGVFLMNVLDAHPDPLLVKSIVMTLRQVFREVHVWLQELPDTPVRTTYVISATDGVEPPPVLRSQRGFPREWLRVTERVMGTGTPEAGLVVLRDDFVPVERLVSRLLVTELGR